MIYLLITGKFEEVLCKPDEVPKGIVLGKLRINTFSFNHSLATLSQIKSKPYFYAGHLFSTGALYSTSSKRPIGKSYDFFQKVYSDKSANNLFFTPRPRPKDLVLGRKVVNNFFK